MPKVDKNRLKSRSTMFDFGKEVEYLDTVPRFYAFSTPARIQIIGASQSGSKLTLISPKIINYHLGKSEWIKQLLVFRKIAFDCEEFDRILFCVR